MNYQLDYARMNEIMEQLAQEYEIWAPKRIPKAGRYSDTDIIRYEKVKVIEDIVFDQRSDYPPKEVLTPVTQTIFYFAEDQWKESRSLSKKLLVFMRPCDIHAQKRQDRIYLDNGGYDDYYYKRMREKMKIVMMECTKGWDDCFCVSMGTNKTEEYSMALKAEGSAVFVQIKDKDLEPYFCKESRSSYTPKFIMENETVLKVPEIPDKEVLLKLKTHPVWDEFNTRCISCGSCTISCPTCTCFTTRDLVYKDNAEAGERRRVEASCQMEGFCDMAGGHTFRTSAGERIRYKVLHKFYDYKVRFGDYHMCVGCGRCTSRCPQLISITATVRKMSDAIAEIMSEKRGMQHE